MASIKFINECKNGANHNRLGQIIVDGVGAPISESNNLKSFTIDSGCYVDGNIIGSIYITKLTGELIAIPDEIELIDRNIQAQIGVKFDDNTTEYIEMGKYTIERPNDLKTANKSQITAYDILEKYIDSVYVCNIDYESGEKTVEDLYKDVCQQLKLFPKTTQFINNNIPIKSNPFTNGEKNRFVLQTIAKIACSFVIVDCDTSEIDLAWIKESEEPNYVFTKNDYSVLEGGEIQYGPINSITIKHSQIDEENVTKSNQESIDLYGENSITICEDYILYNAELRKQAITGIFERLNGFKYIDSKIVCYYGKPFLKIGDKIRIFVDDTNYIDTYILKHLFMYDGTFESTIESPALTKQEIKTKQDISLGQALRDTQIIVNKQKGEIENLTTETSIMKDKLGNIYTIQETNQLIQNAQEGLTNKYSVAGGNNYIKDSMGVLNDGSWSNVSSITNTFTRQNAVGQSAILLMEETISQKINCKNGTYTLSFKYYRNADNVSAKIRINGEEFDFTTLWELSEYKKTLNVTTGEVLIEFISDTYASCYIIDLMMNDGEEVLTWSQNNNEVVTDTVKIGKGIQVESNTTNTIWRADTDGSRVFNKTTGEVVREDTDKGTVTNEFESKSTSIVNGMLIIKVGDQIWVNGV